MEELPNPVGKPLAFPTVELLQEAVNNYFKKCDADARPYTMSGLANSCGVDRQTILNYGKKEEYFGTIKEARAKVEQYAEERLFGSAVTGVIFNLKNNFDWKDKSEVDQTLTGKVEVSKVTRTVIDPKHES